MRALITFVNHTYGSVGTYHVSLTITTANGCTRTHSQWVSVRSLGECCKTMDREKDKEITYNYGNTDYVVKSILRVTNFVGFHRVCTRVVHYKKNKNVKIETKTTIKGLGTSAIGDLNFYADTNNVCGTRKTIKEVSDYKDKCKSRIQEDRPIGVPFKVEKEALIDRFRVNAKRNDWERSSVKLHDKPC
ncbi:MAG: PKD domain-containing protein [Bacteroidales bacterium]|nr:PKD domain-containing protein [Bacteroidales bacterium]